MRVEDTKGRLDSAEIALVEFVARERLRRGAKAGRKPTLGTRDVAMEVAGAAGEYATARSLGLFWNALSDDPSGIAADVGTEHHVKTISRRQHALIIPRGNPREGVYVLIHVDLPAFEIVGTFPAEKVGLRHWDESLPHPAYRVFQVDPDFRSATALCLDRTVAA